MATAIIPDWFGNPPTDAKFIQLFSGNKVSRVFFGILSPTAFAVCVAAALVAAENQRVIDEQKALEELLEAIQKQIESDEEVTKLALASDMRVQDFRRELLDGYAALLLEKHPELIERFAVGPAQTAKKPKQSGKPPPQRSPQHRPIPLMMLQMNPTSTKEPFQRVRTMKAKSFHRLPSNSAFLPLQSNRRTFFMSRKPKLLRF